MVSSSKISHFQIIKASKDFLVSLLTGPTFTGAIIGLLAASVLYSKYLPRWMPVLFSAYPIVFFAMFIVICGIAGYIWGLVDSSETNRTGKTSTSTYCGTILTGAVIGLLGAAALYSKNLPAWVPSFLAGSPLTFFSFFIVTCAILGYIWKLTE